MEESIHADNSGNHHHTTTKKHESYSIHKSAATTEHEAQNPYKSVDP